MNYINRILPFVWFCLFVFIVPMIFSKWGWTLMSYAYTATITPLACIRFGLPLLPEKSRPGARKKVIEIVTKAVGK